MLTLLLSKLVSPSTLLYLAITVVTGGAVFGIASFIRSDMAAREHNIVLQQNVKTLEDAANALETARAQDNVVAQSTLTAVREHDAESQQRITELQRDIDALKRVGVPTSADHKCMASPYIATIFNRLRQRSATSSNQANNPTNSTATTN